MALSPIGFGLGFKDYSESMQSRIIAAAGQWGLGDVPMESLPEFVQPPAKGLVLFADFAHPAKDGIPVYLLNRTGEVVSLAAQDGDVYLKLEYQDADGTWKRGQSHRLSRCGNSYDFHPPLRNGRFIRLSGYQPPAGQKAKVRFHLYRQMFEVTSNIGDGIVNPPEIEAARQDELVVLGMDFDHLAAIAQGTAPAPAIKSGEGRKLAIWELGERGFERTRVRGVLNAIVATGEKPYAESAGEQLREIDRRRE